MQSGQPHRDADTIQGHSQAKTPITQNFQNTQTERYVKKTLSQDAGHSLTKILKRNKYISEWASRTIWQQILEQTAALAKNFLESTVFVHGYKSKGIKLPPN